MSGKYEGRVLEEMGGEGEKESEGKRGGLEDEGKRLREGREEGGKYTSNYK